MAEAVSLFEVVLKKEGSQKPEPCLYRAEWLDYDVPFYIARKYLGLSILANLAAPYHRVKPRDILDPTAKLSGLFCDKKTYESMLEKIVESLNASNDQVATYPLVTTSSSLLEYTYPIFNGDFTRAIIISSGTQRWYSKHSDGTVLPGSEIVGGASIYEKKNGRWKFIKWEMLFRGHG